MADRDQPQWLQSALADIIQRRCCTTINCTTCGCVDMKRILFGADLAPSASPSHYHGLTRQRAVEIISALRGWTSAASVEEERPVRWLLYAIWRAFGDNAHTDLFPPLDGTDAGGVLIGMKRHFDKRRTARLQHQERQGKKQRDRKE